MPEGSLPCVGKKLTKRVALGVAELLKLQHAIIKVLSYRTTECASGDTCSKAYFSFAVSGLNCAFLLVAS